MPYDPSANPYIINPKELPVNQAAAANVPAWNKGTTNQWCQSPFYTPLWGSMNVAPNQPGPGTPTTSPGQALQGVATAAVCWPDARVDDRDVAANTALNAELTRLTNSNTSNSSYITAINAITGGTAAAGISSITPNGGPVGGGTVVTIYGSNFTGSTGVTFGGTAGTAFSVVSDGQIQVTTPAKTAGAYNVVVTDPGGNATLTNGFTYGAAITSLSPNTGSINGNTSVTITGINLTGSTGVTFGGTAALSFTVVSDTQITAVTPAHAAGAVNVVVANPGGNATATNGFTYA